VQEYRARAVGGEFETYAWGSRLLTIYLFDYRIGLVTFVGSYLSCNHTMVYRCLSVCKLV